MLTRNSSFCNFVFQCNNPTYNPSLIRLFIILTAFFSSKGVSGIGFVLSLGVITPPILPVMLSTFQTCLWVWNPHLLDQLPDWDFFCTYFIVYLFNYILLCIYLPFFFFFCSSTFFNFVFRKSSIGYNRDSGSLSFS